MPMRRITLPAEPLTTDQQVEAMEALTQLAIGYHTRPGGFPSLSAEALTEQGAPVILFTAPNGDDYYLTAVPGPHWYAY